VRANYGYADGSGEYFITVDTDACDGCGDCARACPKGIFEIAPDDYDEPKARVKDEHAKTLGAVCPGWHAACAAHTGPNCHTACARSAIAHSW